MFFLPKSFLLFQLILITNIGYNQCYIENTGQGLFLYSPVTTKLTLYKPLKGKEWGDTTYRNCAGYGRMTYRRTVPGYVVEPGTAIYASHSGIIRIFTTGGNDEGNDAAWIDGGTFTTSYYSIYFTVASNQFVYAGQRIGTVIPRKDSTYIYYGIRYTKPEQPTMKRVGLPVAGDDKDECACYIDPVFPEHFVNPTSWNIHWDYNNTEPVTTIKINIEPAGKGYWSFDNGKTWLRNGETAKGLPQKYYKIIFKDIEDFATPLPIDINADDIKTDFQLYAKYEYLAYGSSPKETIASKGAGRENLLLDSTIFYESIEAARRNAYDSSYNELKGILYSTFNDSLKSKIIAIEENQERQKRISNILNVSIPMLIMASIGMLLLFNKNSQLREEKKQVESLQKELQHRVRNNLSIILGLLDVSKSNSSNGFDVKELENRIKSISYVHEELFSTSDHTNVKIQPILETVCSNIIKSYGYQNETQTLIEAPLIIPAKLATPIILIITELVTNSVKHGKKAGETLELNIMAEMTEHSTIKFDIIDNGRGLPDKYEASLDKSFGLRMVKGLMKQLKGKITFENNHGLHIKLVI